MPLHSYVLPFTVIAFPSLSLLCSLFLGGLAGLERGLVEAENEEGCGGLEEGLTTGLGEEEVVGERAEGEVVAEGMSELEKGVLGEVGVFTATGEWRA